MTLKDDLLASDRGFWLEGEDYFLAHVDVQCLLAFPQMAEFHGIFPRERVAETARQPGRWRDLEMSDAQVIETGPDSAILSYKATARQADGKPYAALIGSGYVRREDGWKLAFHQHSPL